MCYDELGFRPGGLVATSLLRPENSLIFQNHSPFTKLNSLFLLAGNLVKFMKRTKEFSAFDRPQLEPKPQNSLYFP